MRSWQVVGTGEPADVTELREVQVPTPAAGQLLVRVAAAGLNFPDLMLCRGSFQASPPTPFVPGSEFAGTVVGGASTSRIGERVVCAPDLLAGQRAGGLAEVVAVDARHVWSIPDELSFVEAAALCVTYGTAWLSLVRRARVRPGETVLVHGGAGGVGIACVQLAISLGARVIATASGEERVAALEGLGAHGVDHRTADLVAVVRELTDGRGADVVVDPVGGQAFERTRSLIGWEGRHLVIGFASDEIPSLRANQPLLRNYSLIGVNRDAYRHRDHLVFREMHQRVIDLCAQGRLRPVVGLSVPFEDLLVGWEALAARRVVGKVVVTLD